ncbi:MAG: hypothetical protein U9Q31_01215 [Chloroflexota bacterium]|nr:hypothetical protein [Chloroflexota bacterium]
MLNSCITVYSPELPELTIVVTPDEGHPPFQIAIAAACAEPNGEYTLIVNGESIETSSEGRFTALVDDWPWEASVEWVNETVVVEKAIPVTLINERPIAHDLNMTPAEPHQYEKALIDLRYLERGCKNGAPVSLVGVEDPDFAKDEYSIENDNFTYHVEVFDATTGDQETVFKENGVLLAPDEFTSSPFFIWFSDWSFWKPPYPFQITSSNAQLGCEIDTGEKLIHVYVREFGNVYHWVYII